MVSVQNKANNVMETKRISSLQEIVRRMKASPDKDVLDPVIYRKLTQLSKN